MLQRIYIYIIYFAQFTVDTRASTTATTMQPRSGGVYSTPAASLGSVAGALAPPPLAPPPGTAVSAVRISDDPTREVTLWSAAWNVWLHIGQSSAVLHNHNPNIIIYIS